MNKYIIYCLTLVVFAFAACSEDSPASFITNQEPVTVTNPTTVMTDETAGVVTVNFELSEAQITDVDLIISVDAENSTATLGEDFAFDDGMIVSVPAYVRSGSFDVEVLLDGKQEGVENVSFTFANDFAHTPLAATSGTIDFQISDYIDMDSILYLDWTWTNSIQMTTPTEMLFVVDLDGVVTDTMGEVTDTLLGAIIDTIITGGEVETVDPCDYMDIDIAVSLTSAPLIPVQFVSFLGTCPENSALGPQDFVLIFGADIFSNAFLADGWTGDVSVPITSNLTKFGFFEETIVTEGYTTMSAPTSPSNNSFLPLYQLEMAGNVYTVSTVDGSTVLFSGRQSDFLDNLIDMADIPSYNKR